MSSDPQAIALFSYFQQVLLVLVAVVCLSYGMPGPISLPESSWLSLMKQDAL